MMIYMCVETSLNHFKNLKTARQMAVDEADGLCQIDTSAESALDFNLCQLTHAFHTDGKSRRERDAGLRMVLPMRTES